LKNCSFAAEKFWGEITVRKGQLQNCSFADIYEGPESAAPVTQIDPEVSKVPRLSRKTPRRQSDPGCCQGSADLYEGFQSATPATQIDPGVPKEPRLSRKTPRRQSDPGCRQASADLYEGLESVISCLSRKSTLKSRKSHACHAKHRGLNPTQDVAKLPPTSMKV